MSTEENKALVLRGFEEFVNKKNPGAAEELLSPDYKGHFSGFPEVGGREAFKQFITMYHVGFPDIHVTVEDTLVEGDKVATRISFRGTNTGEMMGMPATGKTIHITGINLFRVVNGKVVEQWAINDDIGMMQQLGLIPAGAGA